MELAKFPEHAKLSALTHLVDTTEPPEVHDPRDLYDLFRNVAGLNAHPATRFIIGMSPWRHSSDEDRNP